MERTGGRAEAYRRTRTLWIVASVLVAGFVLYSTLRYHDSETVVLLSQIPFLLSCLGAAIATTLAASAAPRGRPRIFWTLMATDMWLMALLEAGYAAQTVGRLTSQLAVVALDVLAVAGITVLLAALGVAARFGAVGRRRIVTVVADTLILAAFAFSVIFRLWLAEVPGGSQVGVAARYSLYAVSGVVILALTIGLALRFRRDTAPIWDWLLLAAIAVYASALVLWPAWALSLEVGTPQWESVGIFSSMIFLVAYDLVLLAALARWLWADTEWTGRIGTAVRPGVRTEILVSTLGLAALVLMGVAATDAEYHLEQAVYLSGMAVAAVALVTKTGLDVSESSRLGESRVTDRLTGVSNIRGFDDAFDSALGDWRRGRVPFTVAVIDFDDFRRVNAEYGYAAGDRVLARVAQVLSDASPVRIYRLSGDSFGLVLATADEEKVHRHTEAILRAVRDTEVPEARLTVSIGWATCPEDGVEREDLLRMAELAARWSCDHGGGQSLRFHESLGRALRADRGAAALADSPRFDIALALSAAADARDPSYVRHSRNVAALAVLMAEESGFDSDHVARIEIAAMLHDVGKIALPDSMLSDKGLTAREREREKEHAEMGAKLVESLGLSGVPEWIRSHHERWDGTGYPQGLEGEAIPFEARIIALADAFDRMTAGTGRDLPMSQGAALQELDHGMGTRFDPELTEKFILIVATVEALGWSDRWPAA